MATPKKSPGKAASKAKAPKKAAASKAAKGLTLPDAGLHIAVLGALFDRKKIKKRDVDALFKGIDDEMEGLDEYDDIVERLQAGMKRLHGMPLDPAHVARIDSLDFDGGNEIYMLLEERCGTNSGGELDTYALGSLEGIGSLSGLKRLNLDSHGYTKGERDLSPLTEHPSIESIVLSSKCVGAEALLTIPKLTEIHLVGAKLTPAKVIEQLTKKGVSVS